MGVLAETAAASRWRTTSELSVQSDECGRDRLSVYCRTADPDGDVIVITTLVAPMYGRSATERTRRCDVAGS